MTDAIQSLQNEYEDAVKRNAALFITIGRISEMGLLFLVLMHVIFHQFDPLYPWLPMIIVNTISMTGIVISLRMHNRGRSDTALGVYLGAVALSLAVNLIYMGGSRSPLTKAFIVILLIPSLLGRKKISLWLFVSIVIILISLLVLSVFEYISPPPLREITLVTLDNIILLIILTVIFTLSARVVHNNEIVKNTLEQRDRELNQAYQTVGSALATEQRSHQHERLLIQQLHQLIQTYVEYLQKVTRGDYHAQLGIPGQEFTEVPELILLGENIHDAISYLVTRIDDAETAQTMYVQRAWESFIEQGNTAVNYRYDDQEKTVKTTTDVSSPIIDKALNTKECIAQKGELGISMRVRGAVIGALGLKREEENVWTDDEVLMVRDIADQLTQTLERLRLLDDISRRAALEETASKVSTRIREEVDIESILERAISELGVALQADNGYVQLSMSEGRGKVE
jgi:GAF domain-containing protein